MRKLKDSLLVGALFILSFLTWHSARAGYSSLLAANALSTPNLAAAKRAAALSPGNPTTRVILGALLEANDDRPAAISHYQLAVQLRPQDYVLWMQLARGQELEGNTEAAIDSGRVAVSLAPFYAQPHWQLGNILVRAGRADGGFSELRLAGSSDAKLLPGIVDLAWQLSGGKAEYVIQAIQPRTPEAYRAVAEYFKKRGQTAATIEMFRAAGSAMDQERRAYVAELITARQFSDAATVWRISHPADPDSPLMFDGGFEAETDLDEPGFGWRAANHAAQLKLSLDNSNPREGRSSLRVDFNGESNASLPVISQLVLLEPKTHYQLQLAFRTENVVSGGLPTIMIVDPSNNNKVLGQTDALPQTTEGWRNTTIDFTTPESTSAIQIALQRQPCATPQCPIFGSLWLDKFDLQKR
ncbi:MAG TPA: hypothetical protein VIF64_18215 [Pyrinomonadaceae bacterium]